MGEERYETKEYAEYSDNVDYCLACFPPSDLVESIYNDTFCIDLKNTFLRLAGFDENFSKEVLKDNEKKKFLKL